MLSDCNRTGVDSAREAIRAAILEVDASAYALSFTSVQGNSGASLMKLEFHCVAI